MFITMKNSASLPFLPLNDKYLFFADGDFFFPVGENLAWDGFACGFEGYGRWTDSLEIYGANLAKIVMAPWYFGLEWNTSGLGNYTNRQKQAFALDWVFDQCIQKEIYIMLAPSISSELSFQSTSYYDWPENPYNVDLGGPCESPWEFFTNETARHLFKRKLRYMMSRWGYTPNMLGYELMVEADNFIYYEETKTDIRQWIIDMAEYLSSGYYKSVPVSVSFAIPENDTLVWQNPSVDFTQLHIYEPEGGDLELECYTKSIGYLDIYQKPLVLGEFGLYHIHDSVIKKDPGGIVFHNTIWATLMSEAFTCAMTWHWDSYIDSLHLYHHFGPLIKFVENTDVSLYESGTKIIQTYADTNLAVTVKPRFFSFQEQTKYDTFYIRRDGSIQPDNNYLGEVLYGTGPVGQNLRNPPTFLVSFAQDGQFVFKTAETVINPNIKITVDEVEVFNGIVEPLNEYSIAIDSGEHAILIENRGRNSNKETDYNVEKQIVNDMLISNYITFFCNFELFQTNK